MKQERHEGNLVPFFMLKILSIIVAIPLLLIAIIALAIQAPILTIIIVVLVLVGLFCEEDSEPKKKFDPSVFDKPTKYKTGFVATMQRLNARDQIQPDPNWEPDILFSWDKEKYEAYLQSDKWKKIRQIVLARDGYICQVCGTCENLQIHHMSYDYLYHEEDNNYEDLITLCGYHHEQEHI